MANCARLRRHAARRAEERYGIKLTKEMLQELVRKIQSHRSKLVPQVNSWTRTVHLVELNSRIFKVVYSKVKKEIVTFLPLD